MNLRVAIDVADPWQLTREPGAPPQCADVTDVRDADSRTSAGTLLLDLLEPLEFHGATYGRLVARLRGGSLRTLLDGETVEADLYGVPLDGEIADPLGLDWWRGGLGMIASLRRA